MEENGPSPPQVGPCAYLMAQYRRSGGMFPMPGQMPPSPVMAYPYHHSPHSQLFVGVATPRPHEPRLSTPVAVRNFAPLNLDLGLPRPRFGDIRPVHPFAYNRFAMPPFAPLRYRQPARPVLYFDRRPGLEHAIHAEGETVSGPGAECEEVVQEQQGEQSETLFSTDILETVEEAVVNVDETGEPEDRSSETECPSFPAEEPAGSADEETLKEGNNSPDNNLYFDDVEQAVSSIDNILQETIAKDFQAEVEASAVKSSEDDDLPTIEAGGRPVAGMAEEPEEEVIRAAKSLFSKRTRTLYHWLFPDTPKTKLKATVSAAWDTLSQHEKKFYVSQVLGRFGLRASNLMVNPQLDGLKCPSIDVLKQQASSTLGNIDNAPPSTAETERAVQDLLASCDDVNGWTPYQQNSDESQDTPTPSKGRGKKRKCAKDWDSANEIEKEEEALIKRRREEEDEELERELHKFQNMTEDPFDDVWDEPDDLYENNSLI